jgi:hypothetical protein
MEQTVDASSAKQTARALLATCGEFVYLASFPRSANGWVRVVIGASCLAANGVDISSARTKVTYIDGSKDGYFTIETDKGEYDITHVVPDSYLLEALPVREKSAHLKHPCVAKTHHLVDCQHQKTMFLFREPVHCVVSAALLLNGDVIRRHPRKVNETVNYLSKFYEVTLTHYLTQARRHPGHCIPMSLESLSSKTASTRLCNALVRLGIHLNEANVEASMRQFPLESGYDRTLFNHLSPRTRKRLQRLESRYQEARALEQHP